MELLFIYLRSEPNDEDLYEILNILLNQINKSKFIDRKLIKTIKIEILKLEHNKYKDSFNKKLSWFFPFLRIKLNFSEEIILKIYNIILEELLQKKSRKEYDKIKTLASAVHNFPNFAIGKGNINSKDEFWNNHICFYERVHHEKIFEEFKELFVKKEP